MLNSPACSYHQLVSVIAGIKSVPSVFLPEYLKPGKKANPNARCQTIPNNTGGKKIVPGLEIMEN